MRGRRGPIRDKDECEVTNEREGSGDVVTISNQE